MKTIYDLLEYAYESRKNDVLNIYMGTISLQIYVNSPLQILVRNHKGYGMMKFTVLDKNRCRVAVQESNKKDDDSSIDHSSSVDFPFETPLSDLKKQFQKKAFVQPIVAELSDSEIKKINVKKMQVRADMNQHFVRLFSNFGLNHVRICRYLEKELVLEEGSAKMCFYQRKQFHKDLLKKEELIRITSNIIDSILEDDAIDPDVRNRIRTEWPNCKQSFFSTFSDYYFYELRYLEEKHEREKSKKK